MPLQTAEPQVSVDKVENKPVKAGAHKFAWLTITGLSPDQNRVQIEPGRLGMKRIDACRPQPIEEPFSVAWDGDTMQPGFVFDGWQDGETRILVEAWGL